MLLDYSLTVCYQLRSSQLSNYNYLYCFRYLQMHLDEELELQLSPSRWSKRCSAEEVLKNHVKFVTEASNLARKNIPCQLDVAYGSQEREKLDIFGTDLPDDAPIFIYIHGGYWQELSRELSSYMVKPLHKHKFKVIVLGHTLCPEVNLAAIIRQIRNAFLTCVEYAEGKGSRGLYLGGHSSGAHLAVSLFQTLLSLLSPKNGNLLKCVFLISGVYDLTGLTKTYINEPLNLNGATARKLSPLYRKFEAPTSIKFFVIIGEHDSPTFKHQSELFHKKLESLGNKSELFLVQKVDHFDLVEKLHEEDYEITRLIINCMHYK